MLAYNDIRIIYVSGNIMIEIKYICKKEVTMTTHTIENNYLSIKVQDLGAELISVKDKSTGTEYIWDADPNYWKRHSPILFPFVGSQYEKKFIYSGVEYKMGQHGFARDRDFILKEKGEDFLIFGLKADKYTLTLYPFEFYLEVKYELKEREVGVYWTVENKDQKKMYFQIGGHPAFFCPITDEEQSEYFIRFHHAKRLNIRAIDMETGLAKKESEFIDMDLVEEDNGYLRIHENLFDNDALVVEDYQCKEVALCKPDKSPYVTVSFDAPLFGVWSPAGKKAPFVCIEPWYGRCDSVNFRGSLEEKEYINKLQPDEVFRASYTMKFS